MQHTTDSPTMDEINSLPYLDGVIREVMRLHAPVAQSERIAVRDCVVPLGGSGSRDKNGAVMDRLRWVKSQRSRLQLSAVEFTKIANWYWQVARRRHRQASNTCYKQVEGDLG